MHADLTRKGEWFHSKGMGISNVCFYDLLERFLCTLQHIEKVREMLILLAGTLTLNILT